MQKIKKLFRWQITPTTFIACLALFFAIDSGAANATIHFISGSSIKPHSITLKQISKKTVAALQGQQGPAGATGATGPQGATGLAGAAAPAVSSTVGVSVLSQPITVGPGGVGGGSIDCPAGEEAISGGIGEVDGPIVVQWDGPALISNGEAGAWQVDYTNDDNSVTLHATEYTDCLSTN